MIKPGLDKLDKVCMLMLQHVWKRIWSVWARIQGKPYNNKSLCPDDPTQTIKTSPWWLQTFCRPYGISALQWATVSWYNRSLQSQGRERLLTQLIKHLIALLSYSWTGFILVHKCLSIVSWVIARLEFYLHPPWATSLPNCVLVHTSYKLSNWSNQLLNVNHSDHDISHSQQLAKL